MKFLWTDDKTGTFSGTTLRTWILFLVTILLGIFLFALFASAIFVSNLQEGATAWGDKLIDVFTIFAYTSFGGSALYLGKRFTENPSVKSIRKNKAGKN